MPEQPEKTAEHIALSKADWGEEETRGGSCELVSPVETRASPRLRQVTGPGAPREFWVVQDRLIIGRSVGADINVDAPELSRQHVLFERDDDGYRCTDLDSLHGVYLNGLRVHACRLRPGDTLQLGPVAFVFESDE